MTALQSLIAFSLWTLALVALVFLYRGLRFLRGTPINHWPRGNKPGDDAAFIKRVEDAHANCLEMLPVFAAIVLGAAAMGKGEGIAALAPCVFYARMGQSLAHLWGVGRLQVLVRATFWSAQLGLCIWMAWRLLTG
jgi:uncharacterized MAPEG superfamily protein